jgi:hypothetical protein
MDQGPLVIEEIEAGAQLVREFDRYAPVKAAFWLKASDEDQRYLYLASDRIDDTNFDLAYGEVLRVAGEIQSPYLDPFRVMVISGDDPLALAAAELNNRFPGRLPTRFGGTRFGGLTVDDVYIYPSPIAVADSFATRR